MGFRLTKTWRNVIAIGIVTLSTETLRAQPIGPLQYASFVDSPFAGRGVAGHFFVEEFNTRPALIFHDVNGFETPYSKPSTPGVEIEPNVDWQGDSIQVSGGCTASIPGSCFSSIGFAFDATQLGSLPQAVGIAVTGFGRVTLRAYDFNSNLVATVPLTNIFTAPPGVDFPPPSTTFLGAEYAGGIALIVVNSTDPILQADDLQYGQLVPEPSSISLAVIGLCFVRTPRRGRA